MRDVTIIVPVHNGAEYLEESLASVLAQDVDMEVHVLDDASTDESPLIAQSSGDPRLRYSKNPERFGLFKTLNRGFREACTPVVRIWAQDDRMLPGSLRRFLEFTEAHPGAGVTFCRFMNIDSEGTRTGAEAPLSSQWRRVPETFGGQLAALLFWSYGCLPGNISTVSMRRSTWAALGGFIEGIQQAPDYDMWVRASEIAEIGFIDEALVELRDHPAQLSKQGGRLMTTIEEELPVVRRLEARLRGLLSERELQRGWRWRRGREHIHWIARAILRGDLGAALRGIRAVRQYGQPLQQAAVWFLTANGRVGISDRGLLFDERARRLDASAAVSDGTRSAPTVP